MKNCKSDGCSNLARTTSRGSKFCGPCIMSKHRYGISIPERNNLLVKQGGECSICSKKISFDGTAGSKDTTANVDHCHTTGKVRAILCWPCNTGIGKLQESPELLRLAANYLEKYVVQTEVEEGHSRGDETHSQSDQRTDAVQVSGKLEGTHRRTQ